jgi:hypothetical protein
MGKKDITVHRSNAGKEKTSPTIRYPIETPLS